MKAAIETVIKVGGSLGRYSKPLDLMRRIKEIGRWHKILVVPGGGAFANGVRGYDRQMNLKKDVAHWMAVLAMDQYGYLISSLIPKSKTVQSLSDAHSVASKGHVPIFLTHNLLRQNNGLPHSWDVTSDSIAAWVAYKVGARKLILLKSVDGVYENEAYPPNKPALLDTITVQQLAYSKGVDPYLATIVEKTKLEVWVINGKHPARLTQLFTRGETKGTHLSPPAS